MVSGGRMRLTMKEKNLLVRVTAGRYQRSSKREKRVILDEFVEATLYHRTHASYLLSRHGKKLRADAKTVYVGDITKRFGKKRGRTYGPEVAEALRQIWQVADYICGKRLVAAMPEMIAKLCQFGELKTSREVREKLLRLSAATIDRLLAGENCGGNASGDFCQTLSLTDIAGIYRYRQTCVVRKADRPSGPSIHLIDEFPAGYSSAGCSPASPASATPVTEIMNGFQALIQNNAQSPNKGLSRFLRQATNIISSRFSNEAIGRYFHFCLSRKFEGWCNKKRVKIILCLIAP